MRSLLVRPRKRVRIRCVLTPCVIHDERGAVAQILPSRVVAPKVLPVTQVDRPSQKGGFTSNRIRPTTKSHTFLLPKNRRKQRGTLVRTSDARRNKGEIRLAGRISRDVMRANTVRQYVLTMAGAAQTIPEAFGNRKGGSMSTTGAGTRQAESVTDALTWRSLGSTSTRRSSSSMAFEDAWWLALFAIETAGDKHCPSPGDASLVRPRQSHAGVSRSEV